MSPGAPEALVDVFWHDDVLFHDTGQGVFEAPESDLLTVPTVHPESADRIRNIKSILQRGPIAPFLAWRHGRHAEPHELRRFHDAAYIDAIRSAAAQGKRFTSTTVLRPGAWPALLAASGTVLAALDHLLSPSGRPAYALVRPPGHHAARAMADGYCFFNHAGIAAEAARAAGLERVAIVDWDVHHGNGTQEGFYARSDVLTVSMHMDHGSWGPTHPQTGGIEEIGDGAGRGFNVNVPLPMGSTDSAYLAAFDAIVAPALRRFEPELVIVACGVDAGQFDPNGRQLVTMRGFHALAARMRALAAGTACRAPLVIQEGGYNPAYAAFSVHAALEGFAGLGQQLPDPLAYMPQFEERSRSDVDALRQGIMQMEAFL